MERQFNACQTPRSMYLSVFNSFRFIRCLSQRVSPKIAIFTTFWFQIVSQHVPIYLQQFPSYSNRKCKKSPFSRTAAAHIFVSPGDAPAIITLFLHFCFPWGRPWGNHAKCCMGGKRIRCLQMVSLHVPSNYNRF